MPVRTGIVDGRVRTVDIDTGNVALNPNGNARDGGGWPNTPNGHGKAERQAGYVNTAEIQKAAQVAKPAPRKPPVTGPAGRKKALAPRGGSKK